MEPAAQTYDVFLSYNTRDYRAVERIGWWLKDHGLTCFMDRWYLVPGMPWPVALEQALERSKAVAIFLGPGEMGRWQQREQHLALDRQTLAKIPVVPVLLPGSDPPLGFLRLNTWVDLRGGLHEEGPLNVLKDAVHGLAPAEREPESQVALRTVCPFRGLLPYREEDAPFFFGRQDDTNQLVDAVSRHPFVAVLGASGSGKSSVVRAGLVPRLRADPDTVWDVITMVPTDRPLHSLVNALSPLLWPDLDDEVKRRVKANENTSDLEKGSLSLRDLAEIALGKQPGTQRLLLVVDQWEELYTLCRDGGVIRSFTDQLLDATKTAPVTVILTCRADFYGRVLDYRPLVDRISKDAQVTLGPLNERELREVVEGPAAKASLEFEPGLSRRILGDMGQEPGRLPLLSFLLEQLWKRRRGTVLTNEAYDAMGGVDEAIASVAEEVFARIPERDQQLLPKLFIQLVSVGEESEDTRRRAPLTTLGEEARSLIAGLATARLLVTSSDQGIETVEVAHEALIRHWKRSREWINDARGFLTWRKRLEPFVEEWRDRDRTALLRGGLLAEAQRWLAERRQDLDAPEREFIEASLRHQEREKQAEAEREQTRVRLSITAKMNEEKAQHNLSANLAAQSAAVRNKLPQRSVLLASESAFIFIKHHILTISLAEQSLRDSLQNLGGLGLSGHDGPVRAVAFSPDGRWLATASDDHTARLWDPGAEEPGTSARVLSGHEGDVSALAFSPDGRWLATASGDGTARLWDLRAEEPGSTARVLSGHDGPVRAVAFSPDGRWLATASDDHTARLWDPGAEEPWSTARVLSGHDGPVRAVAFSPDGRWLATASGRWVAIESKGYIPRLWDPMTEEWGRATASGDGTARLWDPGAEEPGTTARVLSGHEGDVSALAFSPDGRWLATASGDGTARLWDPGAKWPWSTARVLSGHEWDVSALAFSPDGRWLATASGDGTARLWDPGAKWPWSTARVLSGHDGPVRAVAFSPDGRWLATASDDHTARLWDPGAEEPWTTARVLSGHEGDVSALAFSPDGRWLATASGDGTARLWDPGAEEPGTTARVLSGHDGPVRAVAFSPDGRWLATASGDGTARLWDPGAKWPWSTARVLSGHDGPVRAVAFSPDGRWLATASGDGTARLWDPGAEEPGTTARVLSGHDGPVRAVAFSPDGRWLATASGDRTARLWDPGAKWPRSTARVLSGHKKDVRAVAFSPDGRWLATASGDRTARLWDLRAEEPGTTARVLSGHKKDVRAVAFSPDGRWLATASGDRTARLWDLRAEEPGTTARVLSGHEWDVSALAFSPDGRWLATASDDHTARLWDPGAEEPGTTARVLSGHKKDIRAVAFSPDGRWLVTASGDRTARLWDPGAEEPGRTARVLRGHKKNVSALAISPDGRWLATGSYDHTARLWPLTVEELLIRAEQAVGRNFTREEWKELFPGEEYRKTFERLPAPPPVRPQ